MGGGSGGLGNGEGKESMWDRQCEWGRQCRAWERQRTHTHYTHTHQAMLIDDTCLQANRALRVKYRVSQSVYCALHTAY